MNRRGPFWAIISPTRCIGEPIFVVQTGQFAAQPEKPEKSRVNNQNLMYNEVSKKSECTFLSHGILLGRAGERFWMGAGRSIQPLYRPGIHDGMANYGFDGGTQRLPAPALVVLLGQALPDHPQHDGIYVSTRGPRGILPRGCFFQPVYCLSTL